MIKIGIVDSGVNLKHPAFKEKDIKGYSLKFNKNNKIIKRKKFDDNIGHGTAVYYLISRYFPQADITNIKIFENNVEMNQQKFEKILEYLAKHEKFDILHFSMGIVNCGNTHNMQKLINKIHNQKTIIVASFDNDGAISYPAALENVIGVDSNHDILKMDDLIYVENSVVNIIGKAKLYKVAWTNPKYNLVIGNSFTSCYVTGKIATDLLNNSNFNIKNICKSKLLFPIVENSFGPPFKIKKAAVFPFNKEIHSLVRYENLLDFEVVGYYAPRVSGQIGVKTSEYVIDAKNDKIIQDFEDIEWEKIDTIIVGHIDEISKLTKREYKKSILEKATKHKVNIYSFEVFDNYLSVEKQRKLNIFTPRILKKNVPNTFGKLYKVDKPILTIIGSSSAQGKFTLQLYLRSKFKECGYKVGQIGTEHSSLLFGFDFCFPCGYKSTAKLNIFDTYIMINSMIKKIVEKNAEIIISGLQSGLLCYNDNTVNMFPSYHQIVFEAIQPDAVIICVNPYDDLKFVERIFKIAEGLSTAKVIGFVCFPIERDNGWVGNFGGKTRISKQKESNLKEIYKKYFGIELYMLDEKKDLSILFEKCLSFFS